MIETIVGFILLIIFTCSFLTGLWFSSDGEMDIPCLVLFIGVLSWSLIALFFVLSFSYLIGSFIIGG